MTTTTLRSSLSTSPRWDKRFLELASHVASWSKDPSTQCGAIIVDRNRRVISMGYNGFPVGVDDDPDRYDIRAMKYKFIVHAELNAILNCPNNMDNATLYVSPLVPCCECAKAIIQSGITRVVSNDPTTEQKGRWGESWLAAMLMFGESEVQVDLIEGEQV